MRITNGQIHPELRFMGRLARVMPFTLGERGLRACNRLLALGKGLWISRKTRMTVRYIPRDDGGRLRLCEVRARGAATHDAAGLIWLHGGGYAIGLPEQDKTFIERFTGGGRCVVIAPDYRRSTEAPYPAALEDAYAALLWMRDNAAELGIRDDKLFVGGDSAGGGLCAALCLYARDRGEVAVAFQMPLYPMLDDRMITPSSKDNDAPMWNSRSNAAAWRLYLGGRNGAPDIPCYAAPSRATDLGGMPPACLYVGDIEPFYDETVKYVNLLREQGVEARLMVQKGCFHAFDLACPNSTPAREAKAFLNDAFERALDTYTAPQPPRS